MEPPEKKSKFLLQIKSLDEPMEDLSYTREVIHAVLTTGKGAPATHDTTPYYTGGKCDSPNGGAGGSDPPQEVEAGGIPHIHTRTVGVWVAAVMLVAEMAGSGVLALPQALSNTGWGGVVLIIALGLGVGFSGSRLGICWTLLEERYPQYRKACRTPYPAIGYHALGKPGRIALIIAQNLTLVGVTTVFLILSGDLLQALLGDVVPLVFGSHCYCTVIMGAILIPASWLGTPKDFWPSAVVAMVTTVLAVIVVIIQLLVQAPSAPEPPRYEDPTLSTFFLGFGTILFSFGGAATFPTIQNDMKERSRFPQAVALAFVALLLMYLPISTVGYAVLGAGVPSNVLRAVSGWVVQATQGLVMLHLLTAYVILVNPVTQGLEEAFDLPTKFSWQRCLLRTLLVIFEVIIGLLIPDFGKLLNLVGASTVTLMSFVLPPLCYLRLSDDVDNSTGEPYRNVPFYERLLLYFVLLCGLMGGVAATISAVANLSTTSDNAPASCFFS